VKCDVEQAQGIHKQYEIPGTFFWALT